MNTHGGYSKKKLDNTLVLLAGGGDKSLTDFLGSIRVSASKIQYTTADDAATWHDLITLVNTDENVKLTPQTDNTNRPLMMINGGTSQGGQTNTSIFSTSIYANASTNMITANGFIKSSSGSSYVLTGDGGHKAWGNAANNIAVNNNIVCTNLNADMLDGYHSNSFARYLSETGIDADTVSNGFFGGKLYAAPNWPLSYYAFISVGNNNYKMQLNARDNVLYFRAGSEDGLSNKTWLTVAHSGNVVDKSETLTTSLKTIATIAGVEIKAKITNYNTDENVKQVDNNNNEWRPILTKNETGTDTITSFTTFADGITINPYLNALSVSGYISGKIVIGGSGVNWRAFQLYDANDANPSYYNEKSAIINITSYGAWQPWIRGVDSEKGSWAIGLYTTNFHVAYITKTNTNNNPTKLWSFTKGGTIESPNGFVHTGFNAASGFTKDSYVLLAGGGYKLTSDIIGTPSILAGTSNTNKVTITVGGKTSSEYLIPYSANSDKLDGIDSSDFARLANSVGTAAESILNGLIGGKLYAAPNWKQTYYAFISAGYGNYKMQFNSTGNVLYFRSGDENGLSNKTWCKIWHSENDGSGSGLDADTLDGYHASAFAATSHTHSFSQITDGTSSSTASGWSHVLSNTYGGSLKSILYMCHGGGYGMHLRGYSTSASVYMLEIYNSSSQVFAVYGDGHAVHGGNVTATHFYESSDIRLKHDISSISQSIRKFRFNEDNKLYYGFIAQELETLHPELVDNSGEYKTVNYNSAICYYIAELENRVKELEDKLKKYEEIQNI